MTAAAARIARRRANAQLLHRPRGATAESVVRQMLAVQAQDPRTGRLGLRARVRRLTDADVADALERDGELVATWLMRGTIHWVAREDLAWLHSITAPRLRTGELTRLSQHGIEGDDVDRAVALAVAAIAEEGPLTRAELRERIAPSGIPVEGQAIVYITGIAAVEGHVLIGHERGAKRHFVRWEDWLGEPRGEVDRERALAELARRYLVTHGPADDRDLAVWSGLPLRDVRAGLAAIDGEIETAPDGGAVLKGTKPRRGSSPLRLISTWDDLMLGWADRSPVAPRGFGPGVGKAAIVDDGVAVGTYGLSTSGGRVAVTPDLEPGSGIDEDALAAEIADLERFFGS